MRRRELTYGLLTGVVVTIMPACGESGPGSPLAASPPETVGSVATNHGHRAVITTAQLEAGRPLVLDIQGDSTHGHTLSLSADELRRIRGGERVSQFSSDGFDDKHDHVVTFN